MARCSRSAGLGAILFFGGWNGPIPITHWLGWAYLAGRHALAFLGYVANLLGCLNFIFKCILGVTVMIWVRWTLPRLRIDQVMKTCLKYCTPIAAVMFVGAAMWTLSVPRRLWLKQSRPAGAVREAAFAEQRVQESGVRSQDATATQLKPTTRLAETAQTA